MAVTTAGGDAYAFDWLAGDPHTVAETRVRPTWALDVMPDATVPPRLTRELVLRDGPLLRPVAPFLELWALTGDDPAQGWQPRPVSLELLAANGVGTADLTFTVTAMNLKAAGRTGNSALGFGTFPAVQVSRLVDATGRRAVTACDHIRPRQPWVAASCTFPRHAIDPTMRQVPLEGVPATCRVASLSVPVRGPNRLAAEPAATGEEITQRAADGRERHLRFLTGVLDSCRHRDAPAWSEYRQWVAHQRTCDIRPAAGIR